MNPYDPPAIQETVKPRVELGAVMVASIFIAASFDAMINLKLENLLMVLAVLFGTLFVIGRFELPGFAPINRIYTTLVELLVLWGILGVVAGLQLPDNASMPHRCRGGDVIESLQQAIPESMNQDSADEP